MPGFLGFPELMLLGVVVLLVFGPKRLPKMGRSLKRGLREFKESVTAGDATATEVFDFAELTRGDVATLSAVPAGLTAVDGAPVSHKN